MILEAFSVFDAKAVVFGQPFFALNAAVAQRMLAANMSAGDSLLAKFPADYDLYLIGRFDDSTGELLGVERRAICNCKSLVEVVHAS